MHSPDIANANVYSWPLSLPDRPKLFPGQPSRPVEAFAVPSGFDLPESVSAFKVSQLGQIYDRLLLSARAGCPHWASTMSPYGRFAVLGPLINGQARLHN